MKYKVFEGKNMKSESNEVKTLELIETNNNYWTE